MPNLNNSHVSVPIDAYRRCFPSHELWDYRYGSIDSNTRKQIFQHLHVDRCQDCCLRFQLLTPDRYEKTPKYTGLSTAAKQMVKNLRTNEDRINPHVKPLFVRKGQVWTTRTPVQKDTGISIPISPPVIVIDTGEYQSLHVENIIRVIPLMFPTNADVEAPFGSTYLPDPKPMGIPTLVEVFNELAINAGKLDRYLGTLSMDAYFAVTACRNHWLDADENTIVSPAVKRWMDQERETTKHLSNSFQYCIEAKMQKPPENSSEKLKENTFLVQRISLQAEDIHTDQLLPSEPVTLYSSEKNILGIIQDRTEIFLRLVTEDNPPAYVLVNGNSNTFERCEHPDGSYHQLTLGFAGQIPVNLEIRIELDNNKLVFLYNFGWR